MNEITQYSDPTQFSAELPHHQISNDVAHLQVRAEEEIENFELELRGYLKNSKGDFIQVDSSPLCNEQGAKKISMYVRSALSKTTTLGNLTKQEIDEECLYISNALIGDLINHYRTWQVELSNIHKIKVLTMHYIKLNLSRTMLGATSKQINRSMSISEVHHINREDKK